MADRIPIACNQQFNLSRHRVQARGDVKEMHTEIPANVYDVRYNKPLWALKLVFDCFSVNRIYMASAHIAANMRYSSEFPAINRGAQQLSGSYYVS